MNVALVKPDHLGDLVLSIPAIRHAQRHAERVTLFSHPATRALATVLFPDIETQTLLFPHLDKSGRTVELPLIPEGFDLYLSLRGDRQIESILPTPYLSPDATPDIASEIRGLHHETENQRSAVRVAFGNYSRGEYFFSLLPYPERDFPRLPKKIGLCISAGFATNAWPVGHWLRLQRLLSARGCETVWIAGPQEHIELAWLQRASGCAMAVTGSGDFHEFWKAISTLDLVVATDSGSAHLCSLVAPVLSIFGPSPFRRYAPFGKQHRLLTLDLACSPCPQFEQTALNFCVTRECLSAISAEIACEAVFLEHRGPRERRRLARGVGCWDGLSCLPSF